MGDIIMKASYLLIAIAIAFQLVGTSWQWMITHWSADEVLTQRGARVEDSQREARAEISRFTRDIQWRSEPATRRAQVALDAEANLTDTLPAINEYQMIVDPFVSDDDVAVEIFVTTVRSGKGTDGRMVEIAEAFNRADLHLADGREAKVRIRRIASGTGYQFIASRKHLPDAFSPVHHLWIEMASDNGVPMTMVRESMVRSVAGVVMKESVARGINERRGRLDVPVLIDEVARGGLAMGYTNPFASSTGLNFLTTVLSTFADGDESEMLSPEVVSTFEQFQRSVPFVAMTTLHMRESVRKHGGTLDAFVMGHQTFSRTRELDDGYEFIPFGVLHDHPLYAVDNPAAEKMEVLELLATFSEQPRFEALAREYGWNQPIVDGYSPMTVPSGRTLIRAQMLWKEKKDAGRPISAMFLCDVSGSMAGNRLRGVKEALIEGSAFISPDNAIGLATFSDVVTVQLPVRKFDLLQRSKFVAAVQDAAAGGGTAMYDGIAVALDLLAEEQQADPQVRPMLFVLTDGHTRSGYTFDELRPAIRGLGIPVYTIATRRISPSSRDCRGWSRRPASKRWRGRFTTRSARSSMHRCDHWKLTGSTT